MEELTICACWHDDNKPVEHFLGLIYAKDTNIEAITRISMTLLLRICEVLGYGTSTMSGTRSGVQKYLRQSQLLRLKKQSHI